jgi:hypothetical protein
MLCGNEQWIVNDFLIRKQHSYGDSTSIFNRYDLLVLILLPLIKKLQQADFCWHQGNKERRNWRNKRLYEGKVKISWPSLRETRVKRPLGRDLDRSWYHRHTSAKLFWSQPMAPWILMAAYKTKKSSHQGTVHTEAKYSKRYVARRFTIAGLWRGEKIFQNSGTPGAIWTKIGSHVTYSPQRKL